jgi:regulator of sigma E protease
VTVLVSILGLAFLILVHEAGHFFTAIAVGMRPRKFYIGFPPALAKVRRNGIEYGIGAIPLGGYVRIPGMHRPAPKDVEVNFALALREAPELQEAVAAVERRLEAGDEAGARATREALATRLETVNLTRAARKSAERGLRDLEESLGPDAYWRQRTWKRIAVIFAGPGVNIVVAIVLLAAVYVLGVPSTTRTVDAVQQGRPAAVAGLRAGDTIVGINGKPTPTFESVRAGIQASHGRPITITVDRGGRVLTLRPARPIKVGTGYIFGFIARAAIRQYGVASALRMGFGDCWQAIKGTGLAIQGLFHKQTRGQLTSTVGIVRLSSQALKVSIAAYVQILGLISLSLALLNLLPLLPLDGGHILFSVIEGVRRRAVAREVYERASVIGFALLMLVFFIALSNDLHGRTPG